MNVADHDPWLLTSVIDGEGKVLLHNRFLLGRVSEQLLIDGQTIHYEYTLQGRDVLQTVVTLPSGEKKTLSFKDGMLIGQN